MKTNGMYSMRLGEAKYGTGVQGRWRGRLCVAVAVGVLAAGAGVASAQASDGSCVLEHKTYHCSWSSFRQTFRAANTVAIQAPPRDVQADHQLREFVPKLGKSLVAGPAQDADLVLVVKPVGDPSIKVGPSDFELATLHVYGRGSGTDLGPLLWAETLTGQPDIPWPSQVHMLLEQFKDRLNGK